jgi:hypothetical protein
MHKLRPDLVQFSVFAMLIIYILCLFLLQDQFHRHLFLEAERRQLRPIIENKSRIILAHTSSGYKYDCFLHCIFSSLFLLLYEFKKALLGN